MSILSAVSTGLSIFNTLTQPQGSGASSTSQASFTVPGSSSSTAATGQLSASGSNSLLTLQNADQSTQNASQATPATPRHHHHHHGGGGMEQNDASDPGSTLSTDMSRALQAYNQTTAIV